MGAGEGEGNTFQPVTGLTWSRPLHLSALLSHVWVILWRHVVAPMIQAFSSGSQGPAEKTVASLRSPVPSRLTASDQGIAPWGRTETRHCSQGRPGFRWSA